MSEANPTKQVRPIGEGERSGRKPYQKPEARFEVVFETMALSCGKMQSTQGACHFNRRNS